MIQGQNPAIRTGTGEGQGKHAATGAPFEDARAARQPVQCLLREQLGLWAGGQDLGRQAKCKIQEFTFAAQVGHRMTVLSAANQGFAP